MKGADAGTVGARAVERALRLLLVVAAGSGGITLSAAAREVNLPTSTVARLLRSLESTGFASRDAFGRYHAGTRLLQAGAVAVGNLAIYNVSEPYLRALCDVTGETAYLAVSDGPDTAVYLRQVESQRSIRHATWLGRAIPTEGTAIGGALAGKADSAGFILSRGTKVEPEAAAAAAPVFDSSGSIVGAISIIGPSFRISDSDLRKFGRAVRAHAHQISAVLGQTESAVVE